MIHNRRFRKELAIGVASASLAVLGVLGSAPAAGAVTTNVAPVRVTSPASIQPITVTFSLFAANAPVSFTVNGTVVGTGVTNSNGDVTFTYTPVGLKPGYYRLVATTDSGITSSVGFGLR